MATPEIERLLKLDAEEYIEAPNPKQKWDSDFPTSVVDTPIGEYKMGENQFEKLALNNRLKQVGLIKPTLENPTYIVKDARDGTLFIKAFYQTSGDGNKKFKGFVSVSYGIDGVDVVVSNHIKGLGKISDIVNVGDVIYQTERLSRHTDSSHARDSMNYTATDGALDEDITTPKSEVNTLTQELAKSSDAKRLMNSGKVEVVQSVDDLPAEISEQVRRSVIAWHGSPNDFDQFSNNFIGDGTGEQVHGYGTYYSASKDEAARYKEFVENGKLYKVNIKPDQETFLTQKLLLSEHPEQMQEAIKGIKYVIESLAGGETVDAFTGGELYNNLSYALGSDKKASEFMRSMGIRGIKYTNGRSLNYVVFDDKDVEIVAKFSKEGQVQGLFDPATNKTYLIADNLSTADAMGVLTHEVGVHAWFNTANSEKKAALEKRAVSLLKTRGLASGGLRAFLDSVQQRMVDAEQVNDNGTYKDNEEAVAYIVEEAINQFADSRYLLNDNKLLDAIGKASKSLANFIADVITYLKSGMHKLGWMDTQKLTAGDLVAIAKGNMREVAQNDVGVNDGMMAGDMARALASFASDKPTAQEIADAQRELDKQLAIADKLEAEYGYLPAPNGEKSNLNRNQWAQVRTPQFKEFYGDWENESGRIYREVEGDTGSTLNTRTEGSRLGWTV